MGTKLATTGLTGYAVLWVASPNMSQHSREQVRPPKEIRVRWEWGLKLNVGSPDGSEKMTATVYVDREITIGSILRKGRQQDLPSVVDDLTQVLDYKEIPNVKGRFARRLVMLGLYGDDLPQIDHT